eukprot:CAMPEP_0182507010 /NCGR_PEP_ID=MMETSP1321-20130603/22358_1 /TAXON_ID=91990 /ORGANISM="Bolidomonas sp., Strain RCC1657" /LENGTH=178 /DNA_ID=CAMNT_0024712839 /DNA_START=54 /DNA_END=587 /DNA_ORIENTATION=+
MPSAGQCQEFLAKAMESSRVSVLLQKLQATEGGEGDVGSQNPATSPTPQLTWLYGNVTAECRKCSAEGAEAHARGFVQAPPLSVVLCSNRLANEHEVEEVLLHELIHLYDLKVKKLDFAKSEDLAYSEIRAARESECKIGTFSTLSSLCGGVRDRMALSRSNSGSGSDSGSGSGSGSG